MYLSDENLVDTELHLEAGEHRLPVDIRGLRRVSVIGPEEGDAFLRDPSSLPNPGARVTIFGTSRLEFRNLVWGTEKIVYVVSGDKISLNDCVIEPQTRLQAGNGAELWVTNCTVLAQVFRARNGGTLRLVNSSCANLDVEYASKVQYSGELDVGSMVILAGTVEPLLPTARLNGNYVEGHNVTLHNTLNPPSEE